MRRTVSISMEDAGEWVAGAVRPRRWWLLWLFGGMLVAGNVLNVRLTPPGWPVASDYVLMLLIPAGAIVMSLRSRIPGWVIGMYGLLGAATFCFLGQLMNDGRLGLRLSMGPGEVERLAENGGLFFGAAWVFCRGCVLLRRQER
jgi:hypothetical protein